jgi:glycosyltransferase involved in cell wall biosynthesis
VVASHYMAEALSSHISKSILREVPNPLGDTDKMAEIRRGISKAEPPEVLFVGMLNENKGPELLMRAVTDIVKQVGDCRIVFAGRGDHMREHLATLAEQEHVSKYIVFRGFLEREDLYRAYAQSTVVVCPALWPEAFGRVPLEAGFFGRPVVASNLGGYLETIVHNETGFLVPPGKKQELVDALVRIINDTKLACRLGEAARRRISNEYSVGRASERLLSVWDEVIET